MNSYFSFFSRDNESPRTERLTTEGTLLKKYGNLQEIFSRSFAENFELPALSDFEKGDTVTYGSMAKNIAANHLMFKLTGLSSKAHIALLGKNTVSWVQTFMSVLTSEHVVVPILHDFSPADATNLINHSDAELLFVSDAIWNKLDFNAMPNLKGVISLDGSGVLAERDFKPVKLPVSEGEEDEAPLYDSLKTMYEAIPDAMEIMYPYGFRAGDINYPTVAPDNVALINYTSGTTGYSKGVMLTYRNLWGNTAFGINARLHYQGSRVLSFLPLAHAYGCAFDMLVPLAAGTHVTLLGRMPSPSVLLKAFSEVRPSLVICVPLILEKIYRKMIVPMISKPPIRWVLAVPMLDKALYGRIRSRLVEAFGGEFEEVIVGGAPLNPEVEDFLHRIRFPFTVGYGMTECGPLISYAPWRTFTPGSAGRTLRGLMEARTSALDGVDTGEILVRGVNVMKGYYKNPEATAEALDSEGWLHTGDMGFLAEPDNRTVFIRGRYKSMILRANGQNIYPEEIEAKLNNMPYVAESLIVDRDNHLHALIYPDFEAAEADGLTDDDLQDYIARNIDELNRLVGQYEKIQSFDRVDTEFEKTPKRSIKRFLYN